MQTTNKVQSQVAPIVAEKLKWSASIAMNFRRKRFALFKSLIAQLPKPLQILDVGGTQDFWEGMGFIRDNTRITIMDIEPGQATLSHVTCVVGDAARVKKNFSGSQGIQGEIPGAYQVFYRIQRLVSSISQL